MLRPWILNWFNEILSSVTKRFWTSFCHCSHLSCGEVILLVICADPENDFSSFFREGEQDF